MKIAHQLAHIRNAARSIEAARSRCEIIAWVKSGNPFAQMFFVELKDPHWLPELVSSGLFDLLPAAEVHENGRTTYPYSAPLRGLTNLAPNCPDDVLKILESVDFPENPVIKDQVMAILAAVEDFGQIDRVIKLATRAIATKPYSSLVWIDEILANAMKAGRPDLVLQAMDCLLDVTLAAKRLAPSSIDAWQIGEIDQNILGKVSELLPLPTTGVIFSALVKWAEIQRLQEASTADSLDGTDPGSIAILNRVDSPSSYWIEDFHGAALESRALEAILSYRLFAIGSQLLKNADGASFAEFDDLLRSDPWKLFARLRWQLYADYPESTLSQARRDALLFAPKSCTYSGAHCYESAQMFENHSQMHGNSFLKPAEVAEMVKIIKVGPIDRNGLLHADSAYRERFYRKQLYPIRCLLEEGDLQFFEGLSDETPDTGMKAYKPFSSGRAMMVETVPPELALQIPTMKVVELWKFLNNWTPGQYRGDPEKWWVEEDVSALAIKFADHVDANPGKFEASSQWWQNIRRPRILSALLERALNRITNLEQKVEGEAITPTADDWQTWFGVASWISCHAGHAPNIPEPQIGTEESDDEDWDWPCTVVVRFLTTTLTHKQDLSAEEISIASGILCHLVEARDARLENLDKPWTYDWQTTAINSVRGSAMEGLLHLSLFHKKHRGHPDPDGWIFYVIINRLRKADESPAIFALLGSRLRLFVHLFGDQLAVHSEILLPVERKDYRNVLILSHIRYDSPMTQVIATLPSLPNAAIECLEDMNRLDHDESKADANYGGRLGIHLGFYYWNKAFVDQATADAVLDRYFLVAKPSDRTNFLHEFARIFEDSPGSAELRELHEMACWLVERRFQKIDHDIANNAIYLQDIEDELAAGTELLRCECFSFEWRHRRVLQAIKMMKRPPRGGFIVTTLGQIASVSGRLHAALEILEALISIDDMEKRWFYQEKHIKPILMQGIVATAPETRLLAEQVQDIFLRKGFFEYLDLTNDTDLEAHNSTA